MKGIIFILAMLAVLGMVATTCTNGRLAELEAIVAQTDNLDAEFEAVITAYLEALGDEASWLYQDNTPKTSRFAAEWSEANGFDFLIDGLDTLADYRLESVKSEYGEWHTLKYLHQLEPGTDIVRRTWEIDFDMVK